MPTEVTINVGDIADIAELHQRFAAAFRFPDYYGANWDAFWDCIRDPKQSQMPRKVLLKGWRTFAERFPGDAKILASQIESARKPRWDVQFELDR